MEENNTNNEIKVETLENTITTEPVTETLAVTPEPVTEALTSAPEPATESLVATPEPATETLVSIPEPVTEALTSAAEPLTEAPTLNAAEVPTEAPTTAVAENPVSNEPTTEPVKEEKKKGKSGVLLVLLILVLIIFAVWFFLLGGNEMLGLKKAAEEPKQEEKGKQEKEDEPTETTELTDDVKALLNKYLTSDGTNPSDIPVGSLEEELLVLKKNYNISEGTILNPYAYEIFKSSEGELTPLKQSSLEESDFVNASDGRDIIKKHFDEFFGHVVEYNDNYFGGCNYLHYHEDKYYFFPECGGYNIAKHTYKFNKTEKNKDSINVYLTFTTIVPDQADENIDVKLSFVKQSDGNYYLSSGELIK